MNDAHLVKILDGNNLRGMRRNEICLNWTYELRHIEPNSVGFKVITAIYLVFQSYRTKRLERYEYDDQ